jgi:hypothetical protein
MKGKQYTVRGVSDELDAALREEAVTYGKSFNAILIDKLAESCRLTDQPRINHDFDGFIGSWVEDPGFDEAMKDCEKIHPDEWPEMNLASDETSSS